MRRRLRQHTNPLKMTSLVPREGPLALPPGRPVEAELGCGDARFLIDLARLHPERLYVGVDIREPFLAFAREELEQHGPDNVRLVAANLIVDAALLFTPGRVRRLYINFPDPWFKRRKQNRRWLTPESLAQLVGALAPGGEVFYQTDVWALAIEALGLLQGCDRLRNLAGEWTFLRRSPYAVRSSREVACAEEGLKVWRMLFGLR